MFFPLPAETKTTAFMSAGGRDMEQMLWNLFRETGDPMGYLLCKAEERTREKQGKQAATEQKQVPSSAGQPTASD